MFITIFIPPRYHESIIKLYHNNENEEYDDSCRYDVDGENYYHRKRFVTDYYYNSEFDDYFLYTEEPYKKETEYPGDEFYHSDE